MNIKTLLIGAALLLTAACSGGDTFRIDVRVEGLGSEEVQAMYITPEGVQRVAARADAEGRFTIDGHSADPVLVELLRSDGTPLSVIAVADGDRLKLRLSLDDPALFELTGSAPADTLTAFRKAHAALTATPLRRGELNSAIARFIGTHRDDMASALILMTLYDSAGDPRGADSLLQLLTPEARPVSLTASFKTLLSQGIPEGGTTSSSGSVVDDLIGPFTVYGANDSLTGFTPSGRSYSVLAFTRAGKPDSVRRLLAALRDGYGRRRLGVMEIALWGDSAAWRAAIRGDSARWVQGWVPGGAGAPAVRRLGVPRVPFFIVCDSMGRQRLRTSSVSAVRSHIGQSIHRSE